MLVIFAYDDKHKVIFMNMTQYCYYPDGLVLIEDTTQIL